SFCLLCGGHWWQPKLRTTYTHSGGNQDRFTVSVRTFGSHFGTERIGHPCCEHRLCFTRLRRTFAVFGNEVVNGGRKLTPFRRLKIDPLGVHSSVVDPGTRPRSRSLMRYESPLSATSGTQSCS